MEDASVSVVPQNYVNVTDEIKAGCGELPDNLVYLSDSQSTEIPTISGFFINYSTEEQLIGTWIDGNHLYQRTFTGFEDINIRPSDWTDLLTIEDCDKIIHADGLLVRKSTCEIGYSTPAIRFNNLGNKLRYYCDGYSSTSDWRYNYLTVTVIYTKKE